MNSWDIIFSFTNTVQKYVKEQQIFAVLHILSYVLEAKGTSESLSSVNHYKCVMAVEILEQSGLGQYS